MVITLSPRGLFFVVPLGGNRQYPKSICKARNAAD
jgi:hypothetical protein